MDLSPRSRQCDAVDGLLSEAKEQMDEIKDEKVLDAGVIGSAQAVGHYEISRYGTLIAWAKALGRADIAELLQQSLDQEKTPTSCCRRSRPRRPARRRPNRGDPASQGSHLTH